MIGDKRAQFFLVAALLCFALIPVAPDQYRDLTLAVGITYVVLALASALDHHSRRRDD